MTKKYVRENLFKNTIEAAEKFKKSLIDLILPVYEPLQELSEILNSHLNTIRNSKNFRDLVLCALSMKLQSEILNNCWSILNIDLFTQIVKSKQEGNNNIDEIIIDFYTKDKYQELTTMLQEFNNLDCIQHRMEVINSAYNIMLSNPQKDSAYVVIPTLMAQLTGIIEQDIYNEIPDTEKEKLRQKNNYNKNCIRPIITEYLWEQNIPLYAWQFSDLIENRTFLNEFKIKNLPKEELGKYNKFRPKILHGDIQYLNYGTTKNLVQSWLELYLAITILKEIKKINNNNS